MSADSQNPVGDSNFRAADDLVARGIIVKKIGDSTPALTQATTVKDKNLPALNLKAELVEVGSNKRDTKLAELTTMLRFANGLHLVGGRIVVEAELASAHAAGHLRRLLADVFAINAETVVVRGSGIRQTNRYVVRVTDQGEVLARRTGLIDRCGRPVRGLPPAVVHGGLEQAAAGWRGAFLVHGSLTYSGAYSLEVICPGMESALALVGLARRMEVQAKIRTTKDMFRVLVRGGSHIATLLTQMGAEKAVRQWQDMLSLREASQAANRMFNFDDANLKRSVKASALTCARLERAFEILGDDVPEHLAQVAKLRMENKHASLEDLAKLTNPPLSKDTVAGRLRRVLLLADRVAAERNIPDTQSVSEGLNDETSQ